MSTYDLVIRNATVVDGTGAEPRVADVAVSGGIITAVGTVESRGTREIDAEGALVAPGFVDIHTHYDGQATWDSALAPSSWHGVTTVVMGNCGVGFAPVVPENRDRLIQLMEGVEDIPGTALHEGLSWEWQSFGDYLDYLDRRPRDIDLGAQLPHGPVRLHVMGERGATQQPATPDDIAQMAEIARQAMEAGALGFTTSRTLNHRSSLGEPTPSLRAEADELIGIAQGMTAAGPGGRGGMGVLQVVSDFLDLDGELQLFHRMAAESGRPISVSIAQGARRPDDWRTELDQFSAATANGVQMRGQVGARAVGLLLGLQTTLNPFMYSDAYRDIKDLPLAERVGRMRRPEVREAILGQMTIDRNGVLGSRAIHQFAIMFRLGDPPNYEPEASDSVKATAGRDGREPADVAYDWIIEDDGKALLYLPTLNYAAGNLDVVREMLLHPAAVPGLSDGGAHVGTICDVSFPTTLLQWWGRDRPTGRIPIETLIAKQSRMTAETVGLHDRGVIAPGYRADLNVIDFDRLRLHAPEVVHDLPAGGRRLLQRADGYRHTFVRGVEIMHNGESTGATPGGLVRGAQGAPANPAVPV
jgi:N-acyl-D-aspartate/D-glutamate deacylase